MSFNSLIDKLPVACACFDVEGNLLTANKHWESSFDADFVPYYQPCGTRSYDFLRQHIHESLNGSEPCFELLCKSNGESLFFEVKLQHEENDTIIAYAWDISQYKDIDDAWHIRQIHNANPIPACFWDSSFNVTDCNDALVKLLGLSNKKEFIESPLSFSPETLPDGTSTVEQYHTVVTIVMEKGYVRFPWTHRTATGELIPGDATVIRIELKDTHIFATYFQDLRPLLKASEKIREAEEQLQLMIDATPTAVTVYNREGSPINCNEEVLRIFGESNADSFIRNFNAIMLPVQPDGQDSNELLRAHVSRAFDEGYAHINEMLFRKPDGSLVMLDMTFMRISNKNDYVVVEYCRDITEKKRELEMEREQSIMARVQLMFDATPLCIEYWDKDLKPLYCNQTVLDYYKMNKEEYSEKMLDLSAKHISDEDDYSSSWAAWSEELTKALETG